ncbi:MAG: hypothetical protein ACD_75C01092G0001 [uncultured bacterium]|nr:MAG: hypothetical protein ACD_75C01092G0001 [uncultured bacterium]
MYIKVSGVVFLVVTPLDRTSEGSWALAWEARFCTWTEAISGSTSSAKVTFKVYEPLPAELEVIYVMPSTPLTCASIGRAIDSSTTPALAPG